MKATIKINWEIDVDVQTENEYNKETALNLSLISSNLMDCFGDALKTMDFRNELNKRVNSNFKVVTIHPYSATKKIVFEP